MSGTPWQRPKESRSGRGPVLARGAYGGPGVAFLPLVMLRRRSIFWLRVLAAVLGLVAFTAGVVALFTLDNSAGSLFVLAVGVALLLVAILGERVQLESFEFLGAKIKVRDVVRSRLQLAELASTRPNASGGAEMREQARALQRLVGLYDLYVYVRSSMPASDERTAYMDELSEQMQAVGREVAFYPAEVSTWFHEGTDALRVIALNLMIAREDYRDFMAVLRAADAPRSLFEQYYGLVLGLVMLPDLNELERRLLSAAITRAQTKERFRRDGDLMNLSNGILAKLKRTETR
jgi:hypothetical protein